MISHEKRKNTSDPIIKKKVDIALVINLYDQAKYGFISSILCATIIYISLYGIKNQTTLITWYTSFLLIIGFRYILVTLFHRKKEPEKDISTWRNLFILGTFLSGLCWGVTGTSLLLPLEGTRIQENLVLLVLAGMTAGSVPFHSSVKEASFAFLISAILPLFFHFASIHYYLFTVAILIYLATLIAMSIRSHNLIKNTFFLTFENDILLANLYQAKSQLESINKRLEKAATHDPLTQVGNRNLFKTFFIEAIYRAKKEKKLLALLYIDLDGFKSVNDIYGHNAGDQLLVVIVARIKNLLRKMDILSRMGGDELTIILEDIVNVQMIANISERICESVSKPIKIDNVDLIIHCSIGISIYPNDGTDMETLLQIADKAMYYAKEQGGNSYHFNVQLEKTK